MGKPTAKNDTGSGGDERGMHERKCKPPGIPSKASSNTSLVKRLGESENSRSKPIGSTGTRPQTTGRSGSNLRSPVKKEGLGQPANRVSSRLSIINKEAKKYAEAGKTKSQTSKMKQESEIKQRASADNQETSGSPDLIKPGKEANYKDEQSSDDSKNGLNGAEASSEASTTENGAKANGKSEQNGDGATSVEREEDFKLRLETEEPNAELINQEASTDTSKDSNEPKILSDDATEEAQTDADSNSVVVESTTSELSEATESTAPSEIKDGEAEDANSEAASYDSSKLQKNCLISLTNCMEDPQFADFVIKKPLERCINTRDNPISKDSEDNAQQSSSQNSKKSSLSDIRKVSGRRSLSRLRNEPGSQASPNCSLQVNTSYDSERTIFQSPLRPTQVSNGRTLDEERKRKIALEVRNDMKKLREEGESCASDYKKRPLTSQTQSAEVSDFEGTKPFRRNSWCSVM